MSDETNENPEQTEEPQPVKVIQFPLPEGAAMVTSSVMGLAYLDEEGTEKYAVYTSEGALSTQLGLLTRAAHEINKAWDA